MLIFAFVSFVVSVLKTMSSSFSLRYSSMRWFLVSIMYLSTNVYVVPSWFHLFTFFLLKFIRVYFWLSSLFLQPCPCLHSLSFKSSGLHFIFVFLLRFHFAVLFFPHIHWISVMFSLLVSHIMPFLSCFFYNLEFLTLVLISHYEWSCKRG